MLCDAGGGTVDLISYKVTQITPTFRIEEAAVGSGDKCGATYVEQVRERLPSSVLQVAGSLYSRNLGADTDAQEFLGWLEKWIGTDRFKRIPKEKTRHGSAMINSFEVNKLQFSGEFHRAWLPQVRACHWS